MRHACLGGQVGSAEGEALARMGVRALVQRLVSASDAHIWRAGTLLVRAALLDPIFCNSTARVSGCLMS